MAHPATHHEDYQLDAGIWATGRNALVFTALVSAVLCVFGYIQNPARFFQSWLVAFTYAAGIGLGAFFFIAAQHLSGSAASVTVRRIMENLMITLPVGALLFVPLIFGLKYIYPWTHSDIVAASKDIQAKGPYLTEKWFVLRTYGYFALWSIWTIAMYRRSARQDRDHNARNMHIISRWSAPGLLLVVVVGTLAAYDWLMSVQPTWYSTIFGLYYLSGGALSFMAVTTLICLAFRRAGILKGTITVEHYHDLGKWLFALTAFYTYIAFAQYLLIWYANLPAETSFYRARSVGGWLLVSLSLPFIRFFIPFFVLLCRPAKRSLTVIGLVAAWSLVVEFIDLFWVTMPVHYPNGPQLHWLDFATLAAVFSVCGLVFWNRFRRNKMVPVGNLRLEQSLHFENA
ncbi:MAG TPA: hypothetical protein VH639_26880 [Bryobacteraceae bacterium]|jgi:hypothetical protein